MSGKKTYICMGVVAVAFFARGVGWIDESTFQLIAGLFGAGGVAALRSAVGKCD